MATADVGQREARGFGVGRPSDHGLLRGAADLWWVFLITGILWLLVAIIVLRFNETSLNTIGYIVGAFVLLAGINEFVAMAFVERWRWVHAVLGVLFIAIGVLALFHPAHTFWVVAWLFAFYLLFKGIFDITISIFERDVVSVWWLRLVVGILEVGLAFWASGDYYTTGNFTRRAVLLVLWVGFGALFRGINEIVIAFSLHSARKELAAS